MDMFQFREKQEIKASEKVEALAHAIIGAAIEVHRHLGPGMPEKSYREAMSHELDLMGIRHRCEVSVPIIYKGKHVGEGRIDILVDDCLILELKAVEGITAVHRAQAVTYLKLMKLELALIINFNVAILKDGIKRVLNTK